MTIFYLHPIFSAFPFVVSNPRTCLSVFLICGWTLTISYSWHLEHLISALTAVYFNEKLLWSSMRAAQTCEYKHTYLKYSLQHDHLTEHQKFLFYLYWYGFTHIYSTRHEFLNTYLCCWNASSSYVLDTRLSQIN